MLNFFHNRKNAFLQHRTLLRLRLIEHIDFIQNLLRVISLFTASLTIPALVYYFGFELSRFEFRLILFFVNLSFVLFLLRYLLKHIMYRFSTVVNTFKADTGIVLFLAINFLLASFDIVHWVPFFDVRGSTYFEWYQLTTLALLFLLIYSSDLAKAFDAVDSINIAPARVMSLAFVVLILAGAVVLRLPKMHVGELSFMDALFTSASASCVTGLSVIDVGTQLTFRGQMVLLFLMQLGGLNLISFAMFFTYFYTKSFGLGMNTILKDIFALKQYSDIQRIIKKIILVSFSLEVIGTGLLYWSWDAHIPFKDASDRLFYSLFHSVSAFNNAGFSLFPNGLFQQHVASNYAVHYVIAALIILGGLGFTVLSEIFTKKSLQPHHGFFLNRITVNSKLVIYTTAFLLVFGTVVFYFLERHNTLAGFAWYEQFSLAFFQSVTTRTAGFNTVDMAQLALPTLWIFILLMYVGASPGSTGGGVKTTTFVLLFKSGVAVLTKKRSVNIFKKAIPFSQIDYAYALIFLSAVFIFFITFMLLVTHPGQRFEALLFEAVSAFATVGLSTGVTWQLNEWGKVLIIITMFVGRIGPLTLTLSFLSQAHKEKVYYSKSDVLVG